MMSRRGNRRRIRSGLHELRGWGSRARHHFDATDLLHAEPFHVLFTMLGFVDPSTRHTEWSPDLDARDPEFVDVVLDAGRIVGRTWFGLRARGLENVPTEGPALLVGNHSGGLLPMDVLFTLVALRDRLGVERAVNLLGHDLLGADEVGRRLFTKLGVIRADPAVAAQALARDRLVIVYPSSELDSWRPWRERHRVVTGNRTGFLRLALRTGVPIVPMVSAGTHEQFVVLRRGQRIARRLGLKRWLRAEAFPVVFALPWGFTSGFVPYLPLPAQTTLSFGAPLTWPNLSAEDAERPEVLLQCLAEVTAAMQAQLDALYADRVPIIGERFREATP